MRLAVALPCIALCREGNCTGSLWSCPKPKPTGADHCGGLKDALPIITCWVKRSKLVNKFRGEMKFTFTYISCKAVVLSVTQNVLPIVHQKRLGRFWGSMDHYMRNFLWIMRNFIVFEKNIYFVCEKFIFSYFLTHFRAKKDHAHSPTGG